MKKILLIILGLSSLIWADFTRSENGIVTDSSTILQWQDDSTAGSTAMHWEAAIMECETLTLGDYTDWRLPNINELLTIMNVGKSEPIVDPVFQNIIDGNSFYYSSTTVDNDKTFAWVVNSSTGEDDYTSKALYGTSSYVMCVRNEK